MLSSIGRASVRRVVTRGPQSTNRAAQGLWQFQRADNLENANKTSSRSQLNITVRRSYATASKVVAKKPKATKPAVTKRAVKKPAKSVKKKVVAKKPVKKLIKKPVAKPARKVKKPKSEAQLAKAEATKRIEKVKALKVAALQLPQPKTATAYLLFSNEVVKSYGSDVPLVERVKDAGIKWQNMSPAELETYNHKANQNKIDNAAAYKKWVESHTPDEIRTANAARRALRRLKTNDSKLPFDIKDERQPKQPVNYHLIYCSDRWASGDFKGILAADAVKLMLKEWKELPPAEQQAYKDRAATNKKEYIENFRAVFKRDPPFAIEKV